ncbi:crossover junction endodeoxyribonuclease RuvC [Effusibacillus lacus]|uniref:Crossover junction endodeoxyribonuclease RuvC n=1 Tax=Effusibacillus lacus TaxID=1348429 RepID=A0A292YSL6_9BACL|nr:crossover junction endodeoxyribonuclease RuvC [Effusibacillus lacus]TCS68957.1 Holliday junction endonuclease RuvC [Effusibacillus lacus]GAX91475.1 crossover junction endodeoxyribonuclease RuvC [Effusibacillus lacus]
MRIVGIDPGYGRTGYGVIELTGNRLRPLEFGLIETSTKLSMEKRLLQIYDSLLEIFSRRKPESLALEELFFSRNVTTGIGVSQARGVVLLAAAQTGLQVAEYKPVQIKQSITGYGKAEKQQIQEMVRMFLGLQDVPKPDDVADALAVAITHAHMVPYLSKLGQL